MFRRILKIIFVYCIKMSVKKKYGIDAGIFNIMNREGKKIQGYLIDLSDMSNTLNDTEYPQFLVLNPTIEEGNVVQLIDIGGIKPAYAMDWIMGDSSKSDELAKFENAIANNGILKSDSKKLKTEGGRRRAKKSHRRKSRRHRRKTQRRRHR